MWEKLGIGAALLVFSLQVQAASVYEGQCNEYHGEKVASFLIHVSSETIERGRASRLKKTDIKVQQIDFTQAFAHVFDTDTHVEEAFVANVSNTFIRRNNNDIQIGYEMKLAGEASAVLDLQSLFTRSADAGGSFQFVGNDKMGAYITYRIRNEETGERKPLICELRMKS